MTEELHGKLRLTAMTLRGIGSYLHGARLDIRPLTVLCGKNGSGKSTWLQVLDMLRTWCVEGDFPFRGIWAPDRKRDTHDFTNAAVKDADHPLETIVGTQEDFEHCLQTSAGVA